MNRLHVRPAIATRSLMCVSAFVVLILAELAISMWLFDRPLAEFLAAYTRVAGVISLAAQMVFALFPLTQVWINSA